MNLIEAIRVLPGLRKSSDYYTLLPDGIYDDQDVQVRGSRPLAWELLKAYKVGDTLSLCNLPPIRTVGQLVTAGRTAEMFKLKTGIFHHSAYMLFVEDITLESAVEKIKKFHLPGNRRIYERFMEFMILITFLESMKNSKVMLGGIWTSQRSGRKDQHTDGYGVFVRNLADRSAIIEELIPQMQDYPGWSLEDIGKMALPGFREYVSDEAIYLENLYLRVFLKNQIQKTFLILGYASDEDKRKADMEILGIKDLLADYKRHLACSPAGRETC